MSRPFLSWSLAAAASLAAVLTASGACAYTAAKIDEQIRPNFGILLKPELRHSHRGPWYGRRYGYQRYGQGGGYGQGGYGQGGYGQGGGYGPNGPGYGPGYGRRYEQSVTVDCSDPSLGAYPVSDAAQRVVDGGVVYVRAHGVACKETLQIEHPVVIAAEEGSAFSTDPTPDPVVFAPADGAPCVLVAQGVKEVELRGLTFQAARGGAESCIQGWDSELALVRDDISYSGDAAAVYLSGGHLVARESKIEAHTYDAAIVTENAGVDMNKVRIRSDVNGLDLTLGARESRLDRVGIINRGSGGPGSSGIILRGQRSGGSLLKVRNGTICGWRVGVALERGARAEIERTRICRSSYGVMSDGGDVGVSESAIGADRVGVYIAAGQGRVTHSRIYDLDDWRDALEADNGAGLMASDNWFYNKAGCDKFEWNRHESCKSNGEVPGGLRDESAFDRDDREGWNVDGYDSGYTRDGPVNYFDKPKPGAKPRPKHLHIFQWK